MHQHSTKYLVRRRWSAMAGGLAGLLAMMALASVPAFSAGHDGATPAAHAGSSLAAARDKPDGGDSPGATVYQNQCSICHQADRKGLPPTFPSLVGVTTRLSDAEIMGIVHNGKGRMPAQPDLEPASVAAVIAYLKTADASAPSGAPADSAPPPPSSPAPPPAM